MNSIGTGAGADSGAASTGDLPIRTGGVASGVGNRRPYIPQDQLTGAEPDFALAADLIELTALLSPDHRALIAELRSALEIGQDEYEDLDEVVRTRGRITDETAGELESRARQLGEAYPFALADNGAVLTYKDEHNWGRTLYALSLILSHLPSERSPVLERAGLVPEQAEIINLRRWFQYCAAAGVAGEIGGDAWAFGWPRPDGSAFLEKLKRIWAQLKDGDVRDAPSVGSPARVKDDEIDIIAARPSCDGLQGFPIILGQVASGNNWRSKPLRSHADHVFYPEWFSTTPASQTLVYHIIPFVVDPISFGRETRRLGHLMHRMRLCSRALEAYAAVQRGVPMQIEGIESFNEVDQWVSEFRMRIARPAATGGKAPEVPEGGERTE
jgi:hypothetical protein